MSSEFDASDCAEVMYAYDAAGRLVDERKAPAEDAGTKPDSETNEVRLTPIAFGKGGVANSPGGLGNLEGCAFRSWRNAGGRVNWSICARVGPRFPVRAAFL
jgi:hypothetical protein